MSEITKVVKGDVIVREGNVEFFMYRVIDGSATVYKDYLAADRKKLGIIDSGYIGEMALISQAPRTATVVADSDMELERIDESEFIGYFRDHPDKIKSILFCLSKRLHTLDDIYTDACMTINECLKNEEDSMPKTQNLIDRIVDTITKSTVWD